MTPIDLADMLSHFDVRPWHVNNGPLPTGPIRARKDAAGRFLLAVVQRENGETFGLWAAPAGILLYSALADMSSDETAALAILERVLADSEPCGTCPGCTAARNTN